MKTLFPGLALSAIGLHLPYAFADELVDEHVIVTAPLHKTAAETAMPVTVLSGEELRSKAANTIGETLQFEPGISSSSFGPGVGQPVIRGQVGPRSSVIQNGIRINDAASVSPDHANATEPMVADSVEVIRGPATLLYGGGAIGGVVNVIDNRIPGKSPEGGIEGGIEYRHNTNNDQNTGVAVINAGGENFALHLDGFYRDSNNVRIPGDAINLLVEEDENTNGFIGNSNARAKGATVGGSWLGEWGYVGLAASRLEDNYGIPPGAHEDHDHGGGGGHEEEENIRIDLEQNRYDLKTELYHPAEWIEALRLHLVKSDYKHVELEGKETGTTFKNDAIDFRGELVHHAVAGWHGAFGLDYGTRRFSAVGEEAFIPESDISNLGAFLVEDFHTGDWTVELGLRLEEQKIKPREGSQDSATHRPISLSASGLWSLGERDNLSFSASRSQRAPQVEELYSNVDNIASGDYVEHAATAAVEIGDPDLKVETSYNLEFGWRRYGEHLTTGINLFYNRFTDFIYQQNTGLHYDPVGCAPAALCPDAPGVEGPPVYAYEQQAATFRGLEVDLNIPLYGQGQHDLNLDLFGDYVRATLDDTNDDVPRVTPARLGAQLNYSVSKWNTYVRVHHGFEQNNPGENELPTDAWTRVDAAVYLTLPTGAGDVTLFLKGNNLTNAEIRNSTSFLRNYAPEPGRGAELGLRYSF